MPLTDWFLPKLGFARQGDLLRTSPDLKLSGKIKKTFAAKKNQAAINTLKGILRVVIREALIGSLALETFFGPIDASDAFETSASNGD